MSDAVDAGGSRCGICNGDEWATLSPSEVTLGQVPPAVLSTVRTFYRCGVCCQLFWPGEKYDNTMDELRTEGREGRDETSSEGWGKGRKEDMEGCNSKSWDEGTQGGGAHPRLGVCCKQWAP